MAEGFNGEEVDGVRELVIGVLGAEELGRCGEGVDEDEGRLGLG